MSQRLNAVFAAIAVLASGLLALAAQAQQAAPNPRIALVIGNATYRDAALATTANDAGLVAQTLQAAGFDVVGARDLDGQSLRTALRDFLEKASAAGPDMQAFVYLSGRAVQYNGDNYFVPVDAQINRDADVPIDAIRIADFTHALAATPGRARIIVLDAARANPYATQGSPLAPGLALVDPEPRRTDRLQRRSGHAGRRRGRSLRRLRQDAGRRDPAGRGRYRPGVRSDARVGQRGDARRVAALERLQAWRPILRVRTRRRRASSGSLVRADRASAHFQFFRRGRLRRRCRARHPQRLSRVPRGLSELRSGAPCARHSRGPARSRLLAPHRRRRHAASLLDVSAHLSQGAAHPRRAPPPRDALGRVRAAAGLSARGLRGSPAAAPGRTRLRRPADLRVSTISARLLRRRRCNMSMSKTMIGAICLRLRRLPRLACSRCWASPFRSPLARSHFTMVFITTASRRAGSRDCVRRRPRRRRCLPTSNPWRRPRRLLWRPLLRPTRLSSSRSRRLAGAAANPAGSRPRGRPGQTCRRAASAGAAPASPANPVGNAAPTAPGQALKPLPVPPAAGSPPAAALPAAGPKPQGAAAPPANVAKPAAPIVPGGKPLPTPPAAVAAPNAPAAPGGKPLPTPPAAVVAPNAPQPSLAVSRCPWSLRQTQRVQPRAPVATKPAGKAPPPAAGAAVAPAGKPLPPPTASPTATKALTAPADPCSGSEAAAASASKQPGAEAQCRSSAAGRGAARSGSAACASRSCASGGSRPRASAIRASSGSCGDARPGGSAPRASPRAASSGRAAGGSRACRRPPVHAPPPPAAAAPPALRQPPPAVRVQPPVGHPQACGRPGLPPCPK